MTILLACASQKSLLDPPDAGGFTDPPCIGAIVRVKHEHPVLPENAAMAVTRLRLLAGPPSPCHTVAGSVRSVR
jgi:hypothetical protein